MESTLVVVIGIIVALLILVFIFKVLGFGLRILLNPKFLFAALVVCLIIFMVTKMNQ